MSCFNSLCDIDYLKNIPNKEILNLLSTKLINDRFGEWTMTSSGKEAIQNALIKIGVNKETIIGIKTSTENGYVSSCITKIISKFCNYHIDTEKNCDIYFIVHNFGRPFRKWENLNTDKKIIEDCCYAFSEQKSFASRGDYVIWSLPKAFNVPKGGLLFANGGINKIFNFSNTLDTNSIKYLKKFLLEYLQEIDLVFKNRLKSYEKISYKFSLSGIQERFKCDMYSFPAAYIFDMSFIEEKETFKSYINSKGIESSIFYGSNCYFLPCHQNLSDIEIDYVIKIIESYEKK